MFRKSRFHFFRKTEYVPIVPDCPLYAHEKQVLVKLSYCATCPYLAFFHIDGVECKHGDPEWDAFLQKRKTQKIIAA